MRKRRDDRQPSDIPEGGRVLARTVAVDLREVKTGTGTGTDRGRPGVLRATGTITEPPPGVDITTIGADGDLY